MSEETTDEQSGYPEGMWIAIGAGVGMMVGAATGNTGAGLVLGTGAGVAYEGTKHYTN
ncbi:hypothetical protein [Halocatena marina]|uniref:hypothetical protein n=1 Tax=Halocatena marina TaxID=2934937 RepID=UPI00200EB2AA|nr:hypothetical protein [Halocatena marina]